MASNELGNLAAAAKPDENPQSRPIWSTLRDFLFAEEAEDIDTIWWVVIITILVALLAVQMEHYATEASQALDRSQQYAVQAMGVRMRGEMESGYAWNDAYRQWLDWDSQARLAEEQGDTAAAERYRAVRERAATLTPLLGAAYFDGQSGEQPDLRAFEAATYLVEATALQEEYVRSMNLFDVLDTKSGDFGMQIVLLGVALALIALAPDENLLPNRFVRRLPLLAAGIITIAVIVWVILVLRDPVPVYSEQAVRSYAQGVGLAYQGDYAGAAAAYDQALQVEPDYANALYRRGNAHFALGDYAAAAQDFQAAWDAGREELNVLWNLGWTYYVMGQPQDAIAVTEEALAMAPDQVALYLNLGLMHLAAGSVEAAREAYAAGLEQTAATVSQAQETGEEPPVSLWSYLNVAIGDMDHYMTCLAGQQCQSAPPFETLAVTEDVQPAAEAMRLELKNAAVALEYLRTLPSQELSTEVGALEFGSGEYDAAGQVTGFVALGSGPSNLRFGLAQDETSSRTADSSVTLAQAGNAPVLVRFPYSGAQDGQLLVMKVFRDGAEAPWLRLVQEWNLGAEGEAVLPLSPSSQFALADGEYQVELYLDGQLLSEGAFTLDPAQPAP